MRDRSDWILNPMEDSKEVGSTDYGVLEPTQSVEFLVPWVLSELSSTKTEPSSREGEKDQGRDSAPFGEQSDHSQKVVPAYRQTASSNQGSTPGSSVLPQAATGTAEGVRAVRSGLLCPAHSLHGGA